MNKPIKFLIVAESGAGKDTIVNYVCKHYGFKRVKSYTTRPMRSNDKDAEELTHIFVSEERYATIPQSDIVAQTTYNGYHYCSTKKQLDEADIYIVDVQGLKYLTWKCKNDYTLKVIHLKAPEKIRFKRMVEQRGDSKHSAINRLAYDKAHFKGIDVWCDKTIKNNSTVPKVARKLYKYILKCKNECEQYAHQSSYVKTVYISHKYQNNQKNLQDTERIVKELTKKYPRYLFVSPLHCFSFLYNEVPYEKGLEMCYWLLEQCDEMWITGEGWQDSVGVNGEIEYCRKNSIPVLEMN